MAVVLRLADNDPVSPTEAALLSVGDVLEAEAWYSNDRLVARVLVTDQSMLSPADLQLACMQQVGPQGTPRMLVIERAYRAVA